MGLAQPAQLGSQGLAGALMIELPLMPRGTNLNAPRDLLITELYIPLRLVMGVDVVLDIRNLLFFQSQQHSMCEGACARAGKPTLRSWSMI